jgi:hypothetical protein
MRRELERLRGAEASLNRTIQDQQSDLERLREVEARLAATKGNPRQHAGNAWGRQRDAR